MSRGIDLAMQHEALQGCAPRVFLPRHYVIGKQHELVDGWSVPRECIPDHTSIKRVSKMSKRATVRNEKVYAMVQEGNAVLVTRNTSTPGGRNRDDVELLVEAKRTGGLVSLYARTKGGTDAYQVDGVVSDPRALHCICVLLSF